MPYRGVNAKRNTVHDKSRATLREGARTHFMMEKKEHDHELQSAIKDIKRLLNEGFVFSHSNMKHHCMHLNFSNNSGQNEVIQLTFPENLSQLKRHFNDFLNQH